MSYFKEGNGTKRSYTITICKHKYLHCSYALVHVMTIMSHSVLKFHVCVLGLVQTGCKIVHPQPSLRMCSDEVPLRKIHMNVLNIMKIPNLTGLLHHINTVKG